MGEMVRRRIFLEERVDFAQKMEIAAGIGIALNERWL
jgi:hypothetical protein